MRDARQITRKYYYKRKIVTRYAAGLYRADKQSNHLSLCRESIDYYWRNTEARDQLQTNRINFRKDYIRSGRKRRYPFPAAVTFNPMAPGEI